MRHYLLQFAVLIFSIGFSQEKQPSLDEKLISIDNLVNSLSDNTKPGFAVCAVQEEKVIYERYIGLADVASAKPITSNTQFRLGGMAPHFVSYILLDLIQSGKANFNDEIGKYVKNFPDYEKKITIKSVFNHSTGLPGYWPLKFLSAGASAQQYFSAKNSEAFYTKKWKLNFDPGSEYQFNGVAGKLMVQIIEGITGQPFAKYSEEVLFGSLNMVNTKFLSGNEDEKNIAKSYQSDSKEIFNVNHFDAGPAGLISSMSDLLSWFSRLDKIGDTNLKIDEKAFLNNGKVLDSPNGYLTYGQQFIHEMKDGRYKIWDSGSLGGFASSVFRFPNDKLTIIVLSNSGISYNGNVAMQIADIIMGYEGPKPFNLSSVNIKELPINYLHTLEGNYFNTSNFLLRELKVDNDTLKYVRPNYGRSNALLPLSMNSFLLKSSYQQDVKLELVKNEREVSGFKFVYEDGESIYHKYQPYRHTEVELRKFVGTYYNENLMIALQIFRDSEGKLMAKTKTELPFELKSFQKNSFLGTPIHFRKIDFFDKKTDNNVSHLTISLHNAKYIEFVKIDI